MGQCNWNTENKTAPSGDDQEVNKPIIVHFLVRIKLLFNKQQMTYLSE